MCPPPKVALAEQKPRFLLGVTAGMAGRTTRCFIQGMPAANCVPRVRVPPRPSNDVGGRGESTFRRHGKIAFAQLFATFQLHIAPYAFILAPRPQNYDKGICMRRLHCFAAVFAML